MEKKIYFATDKMVAKDFSHSPVLVLLLILSVKVCSSSHLPIVVTILAAKITELPQSHVLRCLSPVMVTPWPAASDTICTIKNNNLSLNANFKTVYVFYCSTYKI